MKNERDWLDYGKLVSSVAQNLQLSQINSQLAEMRAEQRRGSNLAALQEQLRQLEAKRQNALRECLWRGMQSLAKVKKNFADNAVNMAFALRAITPRFSSDEFDQWEDKERLKAFCDELDSIKGDLKSKLGESQFEDIGRCCTAIEDLKDLNRFILMARLNTEHEANEKLPKSETAEANDKMWRFDALMDTLTPDDVKRLAATLGREVEPSSEETFGQVTGPRGKTKTAEFTAKIERNHKRFALGAEYLMLMSKFNMEYDAAVNYRRSLLEAVMRCYKLNSEAEAEAGLVEEQYRLDFMAHYADTAKAGLELEKNRSLQTEAKGGWGGIAVTAILFCWFGVAALVRTLKATGLMESNGDRSEHVQPAILFGVCSLALLAIMIYLAVLQTKRRSRPHQ